MSSAVADLEAGLQAMLALKPPGVSGSRVGSITALCTANVQSESVLIQKLYTHFKKTPATHKLGVLYVVDSVTRKWTDLAKSSGQTINSSAADGTFAAGVNRVRELLPVLMNDLLSTAPDDHKEKIKKLIDIWEKGQTFPLQLLAGFKERLNSPSAKTESTTPPGSPPAQKSLGAVPSQNAASTSISAMTATPIPAAAAANTSSILEALANMARQNAAGSMNSSITGQNNPQNISQNQAVQQPPAMNHTAFQPYNQSVNVPPPASSFAQGQGNGTQNFASNPASYTAAPPVTTPTTLDPAVQQQLVLIKALSDQGVTPDKIASIIATMGSTASVMPGAGGLSSHLSMQNQNQSSQNTWGSRPDESRDRNGFQDGVRSPGRYRRRSRSPSPSRTWGGRNSPGRRREESNYDHGQNSPSYGWNDDRGRGGRARGNEYRQRSPPRQRSDSPPRGGGEKWIGNDPTIAKGSIKVLSRTLFVGGVTMSEPELRSIFERLGNVQTCIVNKEKRHAFVKMVSRTDAVSAKESMEKNRQETSLRTRWGVGFGPRDCSDYQTGVSIIPISKLTDADRKWMLSAEFGGSGGKPIESGMVVEEPDIEIGQGVSSKAISRRMQTDKGGSNGPRSGRDRDDDDSRYRRSDRDDHDGENDRYAIGSNATASTLAAMTGFQMPGMPAGFPYGMQLPGMAGGSMMVPPGFSFPGQQQAPQPPPPGRQ